MGLEEEAFPDLSSRVLALLWMLLFGVRWLVITPLEWTGTLTPQQMGLIDDVLLLPLYLMLFVLTCVVLGLRAARRLQAPVSPTRPDPGDPGTH